MGCRRTPPSGQSKADITIEAAGPIAAAPSIAVSENDWPWWRGPNRNGVAATGQSPPTEWSETKNVIWKSPVPGRGHSSPTVVGDRIYMATADEAEQVQLVVCFDRERGEMLWQRAVHEGGFPGKGQMTQHETTHAACTIACDGERLFVAFFNGGEIWATALDLEGNQVWQTALGPFGSRFGFGASPTLHGPLVIIAADNYVQGYLAAVHRTTGEIVWRRPRGSFASYSSAISAQVAEQDQVLLCGTKRVAGYHPETGEELWSCEGTATGTCTTCVFEGGLVFATGGHPEAETLCVRGDGSAEVLWRNNKKSYVPSMLVDNGRLFLVDGEQGTAHLWEAETGEEIWRARFTPKVRASPILAGGNIYLTNARGTTYVFKADSDEYESIAENELGTDTYATPSICGNRIYLRVGDGLEDARREYLYCIGEK